MIDSHAHLTAKAYRKDLETVIRRAARAGVTAIVNVAYDLASSEAGVRLAEEHAGAEAAGADGHTDVYTAVGIHPHDAKTLNLEALSRLEELVANPKVVAVGEIGLDFYRDLSPRRIQEDAFRLQISLAKESGLPVIIHDRDAHQRTIHILKDERVSCGVLHCFSGDLNLARQCVDLGLHISFAGPITYDGKKAEQILKRIPEDRVLVETDCPYLAPVPYRGKRNEPSYVRYVLERVACILGKPVEDVDALTEASTRALFRLPPADSSGMAPRRYG
jgi:TatD DNase family protein